MGLCYTSLEVKIVNILDNLILKHGLQTLKEDIYSSLYTCVMVHPTRADELEVGTSKLGGYPDLPEDFYWPKQDGEYLQFIGQINLSQLEGAWKQDLLLPDTGYLYFFYDGEAYGEADQQNGWRVLFYEGTADDLTATKVDVSSIYLQCGLEFSYDIRLGDTYIEDDQLYDQFDALMLEINGNIPFHQIGGTAWDIQGDVLEECQEFSGKKGDWQLLFQIDSDDQLNMMWGDVGILYYCIERQALEKKQFENTWLIMQCS